MTIEEQYQQLLEENAELASHFLQLQMAPCTLPPPYCDNVTKAGKSSVKGIKILPTCAPLSDYFCIFADEIYQCTGDHTSKFDAVSAANEDIPEGLINAFKVKLEEMNKPE